jgi:hypothetical protein
VDLLLKNLRREPANGLLVSVHSPTWSRTDCAIPAATISKEREYFEQELLSIGVAIRGSSVAKSLMDERGEISQSGEKLARTLGSTTARSPNLP